jgi:hypothetical protein
VTFHDVLLTRNILKMQIIEVIVKSVLYFQILSSQMGVDRRHIEIGLGATACGNDLQVPRWSEGMS